jgi:hypothetical protein
MVLSWCSHINAPYGELPANATLKLWHTPTTLARCPRRRRTRRLIYPPRDFRLRKTFAEPHSARRKILL